MLKVQYKIVTMIVNQDSLMVFIFSTNGNEWWIESHLGTIYIAPQTNLNIGHRSEPALELHSRAASSVHVTSQEANLEEGG